MSTAADKYVQCSDNRADRGLGAFWEGRFGDWALHYRGAVTLHQEGKRGSAVAVRFNGKRSASALPDVTIWTHPVEHHEIKHKDPFRGREYGLETYRLNYLFWFAPILSIWTPNT